MATQKTDFSLSVNVNPDTSKVQKTLNHRVFRINAQVDIDTRMAQNRINGLFQNQNLQGFDKINTTIQRNLTGLDQFGNRVTGLIKYTETFKNAIGDVNERVTLLSRNGQVIGQSLQTIQHGIAEVTTNTRQFNTTVNGMNTSITEVTKTTRDTGGNIRTVVERTSEWVDANNRLNRTVETLDENNRQLAPTIRTIGENTREVGNNAQEASNQISLLDRALAGLWTALGAEVIQLFHRALRETINTIKEFDSALIEFRKVSDLSGQSLTNYVAKLAEMGELTGSTMQGMVEAATEFRKSSFSDEDSAKLASVAEINDKFQIYSNIYK